MREHADREARTAAGGAASAVRQALGMSLLLGGLMLAAAAIIALCAGNGESVAHRIAWAAALAIGMLGVSVGIALGLERTGAGHPERLAAYGLSFLTAGLVGLFPAGQVGILAIWGTAMLVTELILHRQREREMPGIPAAAACAVGLMSYLVGLALLVMSARYK